MSPQTGNNLINIVAEHKQGKLFSAMCGMNKYIRIGIDRSNQNSDVDRALAYCIYRNMDKLQIDETPYQSIHFGMC